LLSFLQQTTPNPDPITITRGGTPVTGVDFGIDFVGWLPGNRNFRLSPQIASMALGR
jgi:hypothetical protein